jgi:SAM-dependent methyltransferase
MGIDFHGLHFLGYCAAERPFGKTVTIGRQSLTMPEYFLRYGKFCESLLKSNLGASVVDSYDASDYEGATHVADFNLPVSGEKYDTVIDCGTIEHVFDIAQALRNIAALCAPGGQIIHVSPASNFCGHGFWQISPETFFSFYAERRGFTNTEVFLADLSNHSHWFKVKPPSNGQRVEVHSSRQLYIMCRTIKEHDSDSPVQQSDYVVQWRQEPATPRPWVAWLKQRPMLYRPAYRLRVYGQFLKQKYRTGLNAHNPNLIKIKIPTERYLKQLTVAASLDSEQVS